MIRAKIIILAESGLGKTRVFVGLGYSLPTQAEIQL